MTGLTPEEEAVWIAQTMKEGEQLDIDAIANSETVLKLLAQPESAEVGVFKYGDLEIRYKPFLTSKLRGILRAAQKKSTMPGADVLAIQDSVVYEGLAEVCADPVLKNPNAWQLIDLRSKDGRVYSIFKGIMEKIGAGDSSIKTFR
jgi:hypothetical protein